MQEISVYHHFSPQFIEALERLADTHHTLAEILRNTHQIKEKLNKIMSEQQTLDEKVAAIQASENQEAETLVHVKDAVDALKAEHPAIDFTALDTLLGASTANTSAAGEIETDATT